MFLAPMDQDTLAVHAFRHEELVDLFGVPITENFVSVLVQFGLFISSLAAIGILVVVFIQTRHTRKVLELARDESRKRLRAWVGRENLVRDGLVTLDGHFFKESEIKYMTKHKERRQEIRNRGGIRERHFALLLKNYGQLPATNCKAIVKAVWDHVPSEEDFNLGEANEKTAVLMPGEQAPSRFSIPFGIYKNARKGDADLYVVFSVVYEYEGGNGGLKAIGQFRPEPGTHLSYLSAKVW